MLFSPDGQVSAAFPMATEQEALRHIERAMQKAAEITDKPLHEL